MENNFENLNQDENNINVENNLKESDIDTENNIQESDINIQNNVKESEFNAENNIQENNINTENITNENNCNANNNIELKEPIIVNAINNHENNNDIILKNLNKKIHSLKTKNIVLLIFLIIFLIIFSILFLGGYFLYRNYKPYLNKFINFSKTINIASPSDTTLDRALDLQRFSDKLSFIDDCVNVLFYYDKDNTKIEDEMLKGYIKGLNDRYAEYFPAKEYSDFEEKTEQGVFYGIGCLVTQDSITNNCVVSEVYENSPAEKGGLKVNDIIVYIDDEYVKNNGVVDIADRIKGPEGTERRIKVEREGEDDLVLLVCYCGQIEIKLISSKILDDNIGYLDVNEFTGKATSQFINEIDKLLENNITSLIIDLRGNGGGELGTVLNMLDYILEERNGKYTLNQKEPNFEVGETLLVYMKDKETILQSYYTDDDHSIDLPITILTDYATASAAELFTQCLRDYKKADVIGMKTFGKGVVQNIIPYEDGSAIKFTVSEYFSPSGYSIEKVGIIPDYSLDISGSEILYDEHNNIVIYEDDMKYIVDRDGKVLEEIKLNKSTISNASNSEINESSTNSTNSDKKHKENLKIFDEENKFLDEDWFVELDDKYEDKQILQAIVVLKDKLKKQEEKEKLKSNK